MTGCEEICDRMDLKEKLGKKFFIVPALIFALAFALRVIGADWGMPNRGLHPDEEIILSEAVRCASERSFETHQYYRPNHVSIKLNALLYVGIQELYFEPQGLSNFDANYSSNFALFATASRVLTAMLGVGAVVFAYLIGLFWSSNKAVFASLLFAVFPPFIEHSHYITPDIPLLCFLMGVLWAALMYQKKPSLSWLFWMSFFTALAVCEKYPGVYGCVIIAATVCIAYFKKPLMIVKHGLVSVAFCILCMLMISPVLLIDYKEVLTAMQGQNAMYHIGGDGLNFPQTLLYYSKTAVVGAGLILTLGFLYGLIRSLRKNIKPTLLLLCMLAYIVPISVPHVHWERYTLPIYAIVLMLGAFGILYFFEDFGDRLKKSKVVSVCACLLLLALPAGSLLAGSMAFCGKFLAPDSRIMLQEVFESINVNADNTAFDSGTPLSPGGFFSAFGAFEEADPTRPKYGNPRFVMTSSSMRDEYLAGNPEMYGWIANFYRKLDENYEMVYYFEVENPQPHFLEISKIFYAARSVYRYMRGAATGYEIRLYQLLP